MSNLPTPDEALAALVAGNERFVTGAVRHPRQDAARRAETRAAQHPFAVVLACSDSRLPTEIVFDQGLGDLFVVRTAGQVVDAAVLGSIEFGADVLGCPLLVVLGHEGCGAVAAAMSLVDGEAPAAGPVRDLIERVAPSVRAARRRGVTAEPDIVAEHARAVVDELVERSPVLAKRLASGALSVRSMVYRPDDGTARPVDSRGLPLPADR